jgi:hypothetical protein
MATDAGSERNASKVAELALGASLGGRGVVILLVGGAVAPWIRLAPISRRSKQPSIVLPAALEPAFACAHPNREPDWST